MTADQNFYSELVRPTDTLPIHSIMKKKANLKNPNPLTAVVQVEFEDNFTANGGKIIWAQDSSEALKEILKITKKYNISSSVKSKSMTTEEIELNSAFEKAKIDVVETDLGEFIVQQAGQKPYHIVTPAMHMSKEDVALLYNEKV